MRTPNQKIFQLGEDEIIIQEMLAEDSAYFFIKGIKILKGAALGFSKIGDSPHIGKIVDGILSNIDEKEFVPMCKSLLQKSLVKPTFTNEWFNFRFMGKLDDLGELIKEIVLLDYSSSLEGISKKNFFGLLNITESKK